MFPRGRGPGRTHGRARRRRYGAGAGRGFPIPRFKLKTTGFFILFYKLCSFCRRHSFSLFRLGFSVFSLPPPVLAAAILAPLPREGEGRSRRGAPRKNRNHVKNFKNFIDFYSAVIRAFLNFGGGGVGFFNVIDFFMRFSVFFSRPRFCIFFPPPPRNLIIF